ncbi:septal ring lytic transglycosylase RlpA family protein [Entomospira culicis]|uniref:Probable endolytic peptidoglycan transglycosylase RlpA n=1 Tax=Entomospira culicis TaxID=2719989 RepID=A0A968GI49_9SPIO|nr:septal ring lytic transglycosylase RlpA family protein [Entomospira culicis]NIZ19628.1 septal ring lytic transglycosylase RlpA family protein [Entomospira culicis]NIZ69467.1 septal ring lytic transglycosylase RlpA family protein [Entomospira culicis]WDI36582.1 septal ring lytic transglycosylase RlpA family protein [Entomospira culicis]WDI38210.1 septal ring lytic transglycosylase RlpA family protein [Entomospira culicis]
MKYLVLIMVALLPSTLLAFQEEGLASWYGGKYQGRLTANGEIFDTHKISAAHKTLPFGTIVTVLNLENGKSIDVRINDRGPFIAGRIIDLSYAAAKEIGMLNQGLAKVRISVKDSVTEVKLATIQVGAFKNIAYAKKMKDMLIEAGFSPYAIMTTSGLVRIEIKNVPQEQALTMVKRLKELGIENPLIKTSS